MATKKKRAVTDDTEESAHAVSEQMVDYYQGLLTEVERKVGMTEASAFTRDRMSTGSASLDLVIGGGLTAGWYTFFGQEGSCKTTGMLTVMGAAISANTVPIIAYHDAEQSAGSDPNYLESVLKSLGVKDKAENIFGVKGNDGKYIVAPKVRYHDDALGEKFFDWLAALERRLPDKRLIGGKWWLIYEDNKVNKARWGAMGDQKMARQHSSGIYVPALDGNLQALVMVDSYPALLPESQDEDDPNNSIAIQARMFSRNIPRVTGKLRSKRIALVGVNQLRKIPMAMYGPSEGEPCGEALKYASGCRVKFTPRSLSGAPYHPKGDGPIEKEKSVEYDKGQDTYRYINLRNIKNKYGMPFRESWFRLWIEDGAGNPRGLDPSFDSLQYLTQTGQIKGKRAALRFVVNGVEAKKTISIPDFKWLVLGDKSTQKDIYKTLGMKPMHLRAGIFKQIASGKAEDLYLAHKNASAKVKEDDDDDE